MLKSQLVKIARLSVNPILVTVSVLDRKTVGDFRMVDAWRPDDVLAWCSLTKGTAQLMLQQHDKGRKFQKPHGIQLYIICQDLDQVYAEIQVRGGAPTDISDAFYNMRQFFVTDPDGNHICFESPVET